MADRPRAIEYANPATVLAHRHSRTLERLDWRLEDETGHSRYLLPDNVIMIVGADMSVALDVVEASPINVNGIVVDTGRAVVRPVLQLPVGRGQRSEK